MLHARRGLQRRADRTRAPILPVDVLGLRASVCKSPHNVARLRCRVLVQATRTAKLRCQSREAPLLYATSYAQDTWRALVGVAAITEVCYSSYYITLLFIFIICFL